jgi:glycerol kinase
MLLNTGTEPVPSKHNLVTTVAWKIGDRTDYALEGSVFITGAVVQWLRDGLQLIRSAAEIEELARSVPDSGGVYFVPAFTGLGAPHWDQYARGTIVGITRGTTRGHIARAALDSIAFQVADVLEAMEADSGIDIRELRVDGGGSANDLLLEFQAGILGVSVVRPQVQETTALGAAYLAGLAVGYWKSQEDITEQWQVDRAFEPALDPAAAKRLQLDWRRALERSRGWEQPTDVR